MTRATTLLLIAIALQVTCGHPCQEINPRGSAGCVCFENSDQNQCMELVCPEIHVETCTNPCSMTTETFSVPSKTCCSAPYCSIPAPQTMCTSHPCYAQAACCAAPQPSFAQTTCCSAQQPPPCINKCPRMPQFPPSPPPRPQLQYNPGCCCMPFQYQPSMAPPAPSYCVQSVVVGGKADSKKDEGQPSEGKGENKPDTVGRGGGSSGGGNPEGNVGGSPGRGGGGPESGRPGIRGPGGGLGLDPIKADLSGGGAGGRLGLDPFKIDGRLPLPWLHPAIPGGPLGGGPFGGGALGGGGGGVTKRYEDYLEKILNVIKDKMEPDCVGPSPIMVMQDCAPRVVRKIRRRKQRRYMVESCEDPDVVVEEEEHTPCVLASTCPCCSGSCCRRRGRCCRHFL